MSRSRLGLGYMRLGSHLGLGSKGLVHIPVQMCACVLFVQCKKVSGEHLYPELDTTSVPLTWLAIAEWLIRNVSQCAVSLSLPLTVVVT